MANLSKVDESCLPELLKRRLRLIEEIKEVASEIEFSDRGDRSILAKELDRRRIRPMAAGKWYRAGRKNPGALLSRFLQAHCSELLRSR